MSKEIEITYAPIVHVAKVAKAPKKEDAYRINVALKPGHRVQVRLTTKFQFPMPFVSMVCFEPTVRYGIADVVSNTVTLWACLPEESTQQQSGTFLVKVFDGASAIRMPE